MNDIKSIVREDWTDYECPCGIMRGGASWDREETLVEWLAAHKPHSSGFVAETSDGSWSRFFSERPADRRWEIKDTA